MDEDDGGFVLVIESKEDLADFSVKCDVPTSMKKGLGFFVVHEN